MTAFGITSTGTEPLAQGVTIESSQSKSSAAARSYQEIVSVQNQESSKVSISGRAIMLSRLFNSDGTVEPKIETTTTKSNASGTVYSFLTKSDREMLSTMYEYASENGIDPLKLDGLAFDLGRYRMAGPGGPLNSVGKLYDHQGNPLIPEFNARDEAVAQRVLTSKAMDDTLIDRGFLEAVFTPTRMSVHASDFSFLEEVVYAFSASGSDGATNPNAKPVIRYRAEDFPPLDLDRQDVASGHNMMLSRLSENNLSSRVGALSSLSDNEGLIKLLDLLNDNDKDIFSRFYAIAQIRNEELTGIDNLALMLGNYRMLDTISS